MPYQKRYRVAFFSMTSCEGCQLMVLSSERELPDIISNVNIVYFREAMSEKSTEYDIAFIEGSATTAKEVRKLRKIRARAKLVITLGACSSTGGLNRLKNRFRIGDLKESVYGKEASRSHAFDTMRVRAIDEVIEVDHHLHGCPISKDEFIKTFNDLLLGLKPHTPNYPVCTDCKIAGNVCVFKKGGQCLGPVTRAGCDAICVTYGSICWGCRGFVHAPNITAHTETLVNFGMSAERAADFLNLYSTGLGNDTKVAGRAKATREKR